MYYELKMLNQHNFYWYFDIIRVNFLKSIWIEESLSIHCETAGGLTYAHVTEKQSGQVYVLCLFSDCGKNDEQIHVEFISQNSLEN